MRHANGRQLTRSTSAPRLNEVLDEQRIPAIDVENVVNLGVAIGDQSRRTTRPAPALLIRRPYRRTRQLRNSADHRVVTVGPGIGAQANHLLDEPEPGS